MTDQRVAMPETLLKPHDSRLTSRSAAGLTTWPSRIRSYLPLILALAWFGQHLSHNLSVAHDSIYYLAAAVQDIDVWHANHLLTLPLMQSAMQAGTTLGVPLTLLELGTLPNILCGALTVQIVFLLLHRRLRMSYGSSLLGACLPAVSFGSWYYSVSLEAYAVPMCLMFLCLYLLADEQRTARTFYIVALVHSLAALFHQYAILMGPLILYAIYTTPTWSVARRHRMLFTYTAITTGLVGGVYLLVALHLNVFNQPGGFFHWLLGNVIKDTAAQYVGGLRWQSVIYAFVGLGRALIGAHFVFALPELDGVLSHEFSVNSLDDERFLVATLSPWMARALVAATVLWFAGFIAACLRAMQCWRAARHSPPIIMVLLLLLPMTLMFTFYFSRNIDFWIVQSVCLWIVLAWAMDRLQAVRTMGALTIGLLLINLFGTMQFVTDGKFDYHQWRIGSFVDSIERGDRVIIGDPWPTASFIVYYGGVVPDDLVTDYLQGVPPSHLNEKVDATLAAGHRVFIYDDVFAVSEKSALFYGQGYVDHVERFIDSLPDFQPVGDEPGRRHRVIEP